MFCTHCRKWGRSPPSAEGWWSTRRIVDWNHTTELLNHATELLNHATELLKQHRGSKWHQDSSLTLRMAKHVEKQNVIEIQCTGAAKPAEEQKKKKRDIFLKLMRPIYFMAKNRIPHSTTYKDLIELQRLNGNELKYIGEGPFIAQYTSRFNARVLIEVIDIRIE